MDDAQVIVDELEHLWLEYQKTVQAEGDLTAGEPLLKEIARWESQLGGGRGFGNHCAHLRAGALLKVYLPRLIENGLKDYEQLRSLHGMVYRFYSGRPPFRFHFENEPERSHVDGTPEQYLQQLQACIERSDGRKYAKKAHQSLVALKSLASRAPVGVW